MIVTRFWTNTYQEHFKPVNPNLAITPAQMEHMTLQGRAVSTSALDKFAFFNGDQLNGLSLDMVRGADINDVWEASQNTKGKLSQLKTKKARDLHRMALRQQEGV